MPYKQPKPNPDHTTHRDASVRLRKVISQTTRPPVATVTNNEAEAFADTWPTNFTKGLPHDGYGIVRAGAFETFMQAINPAKLDAAGHAFDVPLGPQAPDGFLTQAPNNEPWKARAWESPLAGHQHDLQGPPASSVGMAPAPKLGSDELATEMAEVYGLALLRDTSFEDIRVGKGEAGEIIADLNALTWYQVGAVTDAGGAPVTAQTRNRRKGRGNGPVSGQTAFRGSTPGCEEGPYISQFLLQGHDSRNLVGSIDGDHSAPCIVPGSNKPASAKDGYIVYGPQRIDQRVTPQKEHEDFLVHWPEWLDVQNGADTKKQQAYGGQLKFIETPRDLATYVHFDALYQAYLNAALLMLGWEAKGDRDLPEPSKSGKRDAFATFGGPHILTLVTESATRSLKAVRRQKYNYHCRARPEAIGAIATLCANGEGERLGAATKLATDHITKLRTAGSLMARINANNQKQHSFWPDSGGAIAGGLFKIPEKGENFMLPMAFPEGSPMHPAYGAGHATVAGSCVTILKAFFEMYDDKDHLKPKLLTDVSKSGTYVPASGGQTLTEDKASSDLTLMGELNKLAANISIGRNIAGVHFYSDYYDSLRMGERIAVGILLEQMATYTEAVKMTFDTFDDERLQISTTGVGDAEVTLVGGGSATEWWNRHLPEPLVG